MDAICKPCESLLAGKARRLAYADGHAHPQSGTRVGRCSRCGACCALLFRCPFLDENSECSKYRDRSAVCRGFPFDQLDIEDVQLAGGECSYSFVNI